MVLPYDNLHRAYGVRVEGLSDDPEKGHALDFYPCTLQSLSGALYFGYKRLIPLICFWCLAG